MSLADDLETGDITRCCGPAGASVDAPRATWCGAVVPGILIFGKHAGNTYLLCEEACRRELKDDKQGFLASHGDPDPRSMVESGKR